MVEKMEAKGKTTIFAAGFGFLKRGLIGNPV